VLEPVYAFVPDSASRLDLHETHSFSTSYRPSSHYSDFNGVHSERR